MKAALGIALVAAHAVAFALVTHRPVDELAVELTAPLALDGRVPPALADRVTVETAPAGPGLVRRRWRTSYRGGYVREVGASQLVGPFQDPAAPRCSGRVVIGQQLLGPIAATVARMIDRELRGMTVFPVGDYQRIARVELHWARLEAHPGDRAVVGKAPHGYIRATATVAFTRVTVPLVVAFVPERAGQALHFRIEARARLAFDSAAEQWLSDKLGADRLATRLAREQIDDVLITTLAPPPPFALPDGQVLRFVYCDGPIEIADDAWAALPFGVAIERDPRGVLPPQFAPAALPPPDPGTVLALDLDVDALDAMLYELWRTGWLDRRLAEVELDRRFNTDPTVAQYLSVRLAPPHLALPPVIDAAAGELRLSADARVAITDGAITTTGRVWGALWFYFERASGARLPIAIRLGGVELACERTPTTLVPCYADLVAALRDRGGELQGALTDAFAQLLAEVFVDRELSTSELPASLVIRGVSPRIDGGVLHLALDAAVR